MFLLKSIKVFFKKENVLIHKKWGLDQTKVRILIKVNAQNARAPLYCIRGLDKIDEREQACLTYHMQVINGTANADEHGVNTIKDEDAVYKLRGSRHVPGKGAA